MPLLTHLTTALSLAASALASLQVIPGATWPATNTGRHIQAHGAGITVGPDGTYYMIGEDKTNGSPFQNINCYSSRNLVEWTFVRALLTRQASGDLGPNRVVERPKVIYNEATSTYVMYLHIDSSNYGEAEIGIATSREICGQYTYLRSERPLGFESRDIGLFKDDDGRAYLLTEDRPNGLRIDALSDDYLRVVSNVYSWDENIESPAIWKTNGYYFMFGSHLTGWNPNDNVYSYARSLSGPWSPWTEFADDGSNTYHSQVTFILPLNATSAIYMGDRWYPDNLMRSTYVWLPLELTGQTNIWLRNRANWVPNVAGGSWGVGPTERSYQGEAGTLRNGARVVSCSGCSGGSAAGYIGGTTGGELQLTVQSDVAARTTLRIRHTNGNTAERPGVVTVNGVAQNVGFLPTNDGQAPGSTAVTVNLQAGQNTIIIAGSGGSYAADIDQLIVPVR